jgi:hypothetical protein
MANSNRNFSLHQMTMEKDTVTLFAYVDVGASGAVSSSNGGGLVSVVKEATAGQYTVTMDKGYNRLLAYDVKVVGSALSAVANVQLLLAPAAAQTAVQSTGALVFQCVDYAGAAVNPASGAQLLLKLTYRRTSYSPWD